MDNVRHGKPLSIVEQIMAECGKDQDQDAGDQLRMEEVPPPFQKRRGNPRFQDQPPEALPGEKRQNESKRQKVIKTGDKVTVKIDDGNGRNPEIGVTFVQVK